MEVKTNLEEGEENFEEEEFDENNSVLEKSITNEDLHNEETSSLKLFEETLLKVFETQTRIEQFFLNLKDSNCCWRCLLRFVLPQLSISSPSFAGLFRLPLVNFLFLF